jgi:fluoroquinolone resistance protein
VDRKFEKESLAGERIAAAEFVESTFTRCDFSEAVFDSCRFTDCVFDGCDLTMVQFPDCAFSAVTFKNSRMMGVDWTKADWPRLADGRRIAFADCVLSHSTFIGLNLRELKLERCQASDVDFREADLSRASFRDTDLAESIFQATKLTEADFSRARNYRIDPAQNNISRAKFSLPEALSLLYSMDIEMVDPA